MDALEALRVNHPIIALLIEVLIGAVLAIVTWFVFSVLFALLYSGLKNALGRSAAYLQSLADQLMTFGQSVWNHGNAAIDAFVQQLTMKWVFVEQDAILGQRLLLFRETVTGVRSRIDSGLSDMRNSMESFREAVEALAVPNQNFDNGSSEGSAQRAREAAANRRTALVLLVFGTPILLFLIGLNTAMLTKFFESFIDEWLSFRWGIKLSAVLGLFFSGLEVVLGVLLYYAGRSKYSKSIVPALKQLLYVVMIGLLALIETYLYHRLALEMTPDRSGIAVGDGLPPWVHGGWLALLGPVLVVALSAMGHELISAINNFVDAGLEKSQQKVLEEMRRTWTSFMKPGTNLQKRLSDVKSHWTEFLNGLTDANDPAAATSQLDQSLKRFLDAIDQAKDTRLNPYASTHEADARRIFAFLSLKAAALVLLTLLFCAVQFMYTPANDLVSMPSILIAGAFVQAAAVCIAAYKVHSQVVLILEGQPAEVLQGSRERWTTAIAMICFLAALLYNCALGGGFRPEPFQWIPFLLALVCLAAFALIGRTIPAVVAAAKVWIKVVAASVIAITVWFASLACWVGKIICRTLKAILYVLAYPFFLVFWRSKLELVEEPTVDHA